MRSRELVQNRAVPLGESLSALHRDRLLHSGDTDGLGTDLLVGAEAIAKALNWKTTSGSWNTRRVYHLAEKGHLPFHKVPGLGLVCRKTTLDSFFRSLDERFLRSLDGHSSSS